VFARSGLLEATLKRPSKTAKAEVAAYVPGNHAGSYCPLIKRAVAGKKFE
jgi:hypothetical protein